MLVGETRTLKGRPLPRRFEKSQTRLAPDGRELFFTSVDDGQKYLSLSKREHELIASLSKRERFGLSRFKRVEGRYDAIRKFDPWLGLTLIGRHLAKEAGPPDYPIHITIALTMMGQRIAAAIPHLAEDFATHLEPTESAQIRRKMTPNEWALSQCTPQERGVLNRFSRLVVPDAVVIPEIAQGLLKKGLVVVSGTPRSGGLMVRLTPLGRKLGELLSGVNPAGGA